MKACKVNIMKHTLIFSFPFASAMGGGERYTEELVNGLKKKGWDFTLVSSSAAMQEIFRKHGWKQHAVFGGFEPVTKLGVILFILTAPVFILLQAGILLWFKMSHKTDVLICLSLTDKIIATPIAEALKMKVIWMEHLIPGRSLKLNPYRALYVSESKRAHIVTVSKAAMNGLTELGLQKERFTIIPPATWIPERAANLTDAPVIGCVSRLHKEKNVQMLLDAFREVQRELPEARLEIYGDGPERELLEKVVKERKQEEAVTFHGWVDTRTGVYNGFRVLAVPSKKESFGMAALEAEAHGIPVVATKVGGLVEAVAHQVTGLLVPSDDADAMARALIRLLKDRALSEKLGKQGRALAEKLYTKQKLIDAWEDLLNA